MEESGGYNRYCRLHLAKSSSTSKSSSSETQAQELEEVCKAYDAFVDESKVLLKMINSETRKI